MKYIIFLSKRIKRVSFLKSIKNFSINGAMNPSLKFTNKKPFIFPFIN